MLALNRLVVDTGSPPIPEAQAWAQTYDGSLGPLIDLSQAAPGAPPPPGLLARLAEAAGSPAAARYGAIEGDQALRAAYAAHLSTVYGGRIEAGDVAITAGCNLAFFAAMLAVAGPGDAVLLPTPWYFNHQTSLAMLGIEPRPLPCAATAGFVPAVADAELLIDGKVRAIVLVTPNNPTGAVYPAATVEEFAALCRRRGIFLVVDETYRDFLPHGLNRPHGLLASATWRDGVIQLYSFSKSYAIPGHRTGAILAGRAVAAEAAKVLNSIQICAPRAAQLALPWAIGALHDWREANRAEINRRAGTFAAAVGALAGWRVDSVGAYFAYLRHPFPGRTAREVAQRLSVERGVLALPGSYFGPGQDSHLRVAFANVGMEVLEGLGDRLRGFAI